MYLNCSYVNSLMPDWCLFCRVLFQNRSELQNGAVMKLTLSPVMVLICTAVKRRVKFLSSSVNLYRSTDLCFFSPQPDASSEQ